MRTTTEIRRLSRYDLHCLRTETPARPIHLGILALLEGRALLDPAGRLRMAEIRRDLEVRVRELPELRRVVSRPGPLAGRPIWVDDPDFRIDHHVGEVELSPPGGEAALIAQTEALMAGLLDRSRPLWRMWFVTGLDDDRVGVLVVVHHALADGLTAMRMVRALLGPPQAASAPGPRVSSGASTPPPWSALVRDNVGSAIASAYRLLRPSTWRHAAGVARSAWQVSALARSAPRSSLNAPVGPRRRLARLSLDQATARRLARRHGCGVNDVILDLVAGGVRALLEGRGEDVARLRPRAAIAVSLFSPGRGLEAGNDIGTLHVPLPLSEPHPLDRLPLIAAERVRARLSPLVTLEPLLRATMVRIPGYRRSLERQRLVNLGETYLPGPPAPIEVLGAPVRDLLPIAPLAGNIGLSFVALSYAGRLAVTVRADADQFPDLDVLTAAMQKDWLALAAASARPGDGQSAASPLCASAIFDSLPRRAFMTPPAVPIGSTFGSPAFEARAGRSPAASRAARRRSSRSPMRASRPSAEGT